MFSNRDLSDTDLLRVAAATALPPSPSSSPVHNLTTQFSTANLGIPMDTTTTTVTSSSTRRSGPHITVKLLVFDPKQPKQWFQQPEAIFRHSHVVSSQEKWDYVLPKLPTDVLNNISDVVDSLKDDTPNPYELVKNCLLETYTPTRWQLARQLMTFPHVSGVRPTTLMNQLLSLLPPGDQPDHVPDAVPGPLAAQHQSVTDCQIIPPSAGHGCLCGPNLGQHSTAGAACGGDAASATILIAGLYSLYAVSLLLRSQSQPLPGTLPPPRLLLLPPAVWSGGSPLPGPLFLAWL